MSSISFGNHINDEIIKISQEEAIDVLLYLEVKENVSLEVLFLAQPRRSENPVLVPPSHPLL